MFFLNCLKRNQLLIEVASSNVVDSANRVPRPLLTYVKPDGMQDIQHINIFTMLANSLLLLVKELDWGCTEIHLALTLAMLHRILIPKLKLVRLLNPLLIFSLLLRS